MFVEAIVTIYVLRTHVTHLIKGGSEYKVNAAARIIKKPLKHTNILVKFGSSIAVNSIGKLIILCIVCTLTMTTFMFAISNNDKFGNSINTSLVNKKYNAAVDLYTPTTQGGQYIPTNSKYFGDSGMIESPEGVNFMPGSYFETYVDSSQNPNTYNLTNGYQIMDDTLTNKDNMPTDD
jgi:hypothetical protein